MVGRATSSDDTASPAANDSSTATSVGARHSSADRSGKYRESKKSALGQANDGNSSGTVVITPQGQPLSFDPTDPNSRSAWLYNQFFGSGDTVNAPSDIEGAPTLDTQTAIDPFFALANQLSDRILGLTDALNGSTLPSSAPGANAASGSDKADKASLEAKTSDPLTASIVDASFGTVVASSNSSTTTAPILLDKHNPSERASGSIATELLSKQSTDTNSNSSDSLSADAESAVSPYAPSQRFAIDNGGIAAQFQSVTVTSTSSNGGVDTASNGLAALPDSGACHGAGSGSQADSNASGGSGGFNDGSGDQAPTTLTHNLPFSTNVGTGSGGISGGSAGDANVQQPGTVGTEPQASFGPWQATSANAALAAAQRGEITLTVHSDSLGSIQLHAQLHNSALGATLGVNHADAGAMLTAGLPALERSLNAKQFNVTSLEVQQHTAAGGDAQSSSQQQQWRSGPRFAPADFTRTTNSESPEPAAAEIVTYTAGRLNLRA